MRGSGSEPHFDVDLDIQDSLQLGFGGLGVEYFTIMKVSTVGLGPNRGGWVSCSGFRPRN